MSASQTYILYFSFSYLLGVVIPVERKPKSQKKNCKPSSSITKFQNIVQTGKSQGYQSDIFWNTGEHCAVRASETPGVSDLVCNSLRRICGLLGMVQFTAI